jgi:hypothetical protein
VTGPAHGAHVRLEVMRAAVYQRLMVVYLGICDVDAAAAKLA